MQKSDRADLNRMTFAGLFQKSFIHDFLCFEGHSIIGDIDLLVIKISLILTSGIKISHSKEILSAAPVIKLQIRIIAQYEHNN
jgi:hypothetical protein